MRLRLGTATRESGTCAPRRRAGLLRPEATGKRTAAWEQADYGLMQATIALASGPFGLKVQADYIGLRASGPLVWLESKQNLGLGASGP